MKLIIDIPEDLYKEKIKGTASDRQNEKILECVKNATPLEEEFKKIKAKIYRHHNITCNLKCATCFLEYNCELRRKIDLFEDLAIIDNHIKELKGE